MDTVEERLASFYLGQEYDLATGQPQEKLVHYDARDLTTHAVCVGMTGSGKTGLGVILLEEAALDGIPSLVIDPKGDMTNLLLTFPELRPEDFRPWVNPDDARRKGLDEEAFAAKVASQWRDGLAATGQGPDRLRRLRQAADFAIFTPGSSAGRQVSILDTLKAPTLSWESEGEQIRDKIGSIVSALLALVGIEADPVRSKEHILLSNIFETAWRAGEDLDLAQLILRVQKPPFTQLGVFPLDVFFPEKDRMGLAMLLNGLVASPTFAGWMQGQPLDVDGLLHGPGGKPQVSVIYVAHLSDAERQFFLTLLLEQVVSWMRAQTGTTSLRALLYMDEMFGFLPPTANPPTKKPLLTLLKQARAFGLGLILATQNPVDLDYKALSNAGTWLIGRMQADRDKQRLLDGLEGVQLGPRFPGVPAAQRPRRRAGGLYHALGHELSARAPDPRPGPNAHGRHGARRCCHACRLDAAGTCARGQGGSPADLTRPCGQPGADGTSPVAVGGQSGFSAGQALAARRPGQAGLAGALRRRAPGCAAVRAGPAGHGYGALCPHRQPPDPR
jgi:hypothetical protein